MEFPFRSHPAKRGWILWPDVVGAKFSTGKPDEVYFIKNSLRKVLEI